jgi:hypothetical protein
LEWFYLGCCLPGYKKMETYIVIFFLLVVAGSISSKTLAVTLTATLAVATMAVLDEMQYLQAVMPEYKYYGWALLIVFAWVMGAVISNFRS